MRQEYPALASIELIQNFFDLIKNFVGDIATQFAERYMGRCRHAV
jgi:hypothetical protein